MGFPEQRVNPPELAPDKQAMQEELGELEEAKDKLLGVHETLVAYGRYEAEQVLTVIDSVAWRISDLEWKVNAPKGEGE